MPIRLENQLDTLVRVVKISGYFNLSNFICRSEHERHSPICQFVRGDITENVPLSLTASNQAAHPVFRNSENEINQTIECTSEASSERYFAVSNSTGHIIVYDSKDILKVSRHSYRNIRNLR